MKTKYCAVLSAFLAAVTIRVSAGAAAPVVYLKADMSYETGFAGAQWVDSSGNDVSVDEPAGYRFVVKDNLDLDLLSGEAVVAGKITFGEVGGTAGYIVGRWNLNFTDVTEGIELAKGRVYGMWKAGADISGKVTVLSPSSAPFLVDTRPKGYIGGGVRFTGAFTGVAGTGVRFNANNEGCTFGLSDASGYYGDIVLTATNGTAACDAVLTLTTLSAANVAVSNNSTLAFTSAAAADIGNLSMGEGTSLKFVLPDVPNSSPFLAVRGDFARSGKIPLSLDSSVVDAAVESKTVYPLLTAPLGAFDEASFDYGDSGSLGLYLRPDFVVSVDEEKETVTLSAVFYPVVANVVGMDEKDCEKDCPSSMTNAAPWSDKRIVHEDAHYSVAAIDKIPVYLRTPWCPEGEVVFPGLSLSLGYRGHMVIACRDFLCPLLRLQSANYVRAAVQSDVTFHGDIEVSASAVPYICIYSNHCFRLDGELKGSGVLSLRSGTEGSTYAGSHRGDFELTKPSPDFTGKITVSADSEDKRLRWIASEPYAHVWYSDPLCFGGPLGEFAYDALTLTRMARLITTNTVVFSDQTRGLFLSGIAQLETPDSADSLTLLQPVTVNGSVYKQGAGTLAMGGAMNFLDAEGALTDTPPTDAANRVLYVQGGKLKPLAADALNGLTLAFSNVVTETEVALTLDLEPSDAGLRTYGLRNDKTDTPLALALADGATRLPVLLLSDAVGSSGSFTVAIMTVKSAVAAETFAKLDIVKPSGLDMHLTRTVSTDDENGVSTLSVTLKHYGTSVIIR